MEDKKMQFKTNINCSSCVSKVTPFLNEAAGENQWEVDTTNRYKVLTVVSKGTTEQEVVDSVEKAGFKIEIVSE